jgi:hypothetical protein
MARPENGCLAMINNQYDKSLNNSEKSPGVESSFRLNQKDWLSLPKVHLHNID